MTGLTGWIPDVYKYFGAANTKLLSSAQFKVALLPYLITNFGYLMKLLIKTNIFFLCIHNLWNYKNRALNKNI